MDKKTYMRDVYSKYWITAREKKYGFSKYDRNLCECICHRVPKPACLLEVAIGTGYPFGDYFEKAGYRVFGVDISPDLIKKCRELYPNIDSKVGDAEDLDYPDGAFDCTLCFHSTWYFPNLNKAIDEMLRVTRTGGLVIFDIQNRNNRDIQGAYKKSISKHRIHYRIIRFAKNIAKVILRRGEPIWHSMVHEVPTYPELIYQHLKERGIPDLQVMVRKVVVENEEESLELTNELGPFKNFARLIFVVHK